MKITLRQLAAFDALARHASLRRAADSLSLSPSAVSMALRDLEEILGAPLFHRDHRRLVLNENGRRLLPDVKSLLNHARRVERGVADQPLEGHLRVGASSTIGTYLAPGLCARFLGLHPGVRIDLSLKTSIEVVNEIEAMTLDVGFVETPSPHPNLDKIPWSGDSLIVFASPKHRLAGREVEPKDLSDERWCLQPIGSMARNALLRLMTQSNHAASVSIAMETHNVEAIKHAVAEGVMLGCLSDRALADELARGQLVPIAVRGAPIPRPYYIVTSRKVYQGELQQAFIAFARDWLPRDVSPPTPKAHRLFRRSVRSVQKKAR
jgi:DNA-binding transcriptional LysR family regulator